MAKKNQNNLKYKVSLNLGGGAGRGLAHIGVLKGLEEQKVPYDIIIGVSMGAFIGSIYSVEPDADFVKNQVKYLVDSQEFRSTLVGSYSKSLKASEGVLEKLNKVYYQGHMARRLLTKPGISPNNEMEDSFKKVVANIDIANTKIPFATTAVCLETGESKVFTKGSLLKTVMASGTIPMIFPPQKIGDYNYVDGGVLDKIGIDVAKSLRVKTTIVFDVSNSTLGSDNSKNALDVMVRSSDIASIYRRKKQQDEASLVLFPIQGNYHWADFTILEEMYEMGYECVTKNIECIRHTIKATNPFRKYFTFFSKNRLPATLE